MTPAGVLKVPWFLIVAENRVGTPAAGDRGDQVTAVTTRSGRLVVGPTVNAASRVLFASFASWIRFASSTWAWTVCGPVVAGQLPPAPPPFAVSLTEAPGARDVVWVSEKVLMTPSTANRTPWMTPLAVGALPWFLMVRFTATIKN